MPRRWFIVCAWALASALPAAPPGPGLSGFRAVGQTATLVRAVTPPRPGLDWKLRLERQLDGVEFTIPGSVDLRRWEAIAVDLGNAGLPQCRMTSAVTDADGNVLFQDWFGVQPGLAYPYRIPCRRLADHELYRPGRALTVRLNATSYANPHAAEAGTGSGPEVLEVTRTLTRGAGGLAAG